jgi:DNA polymerase-4
MSKVEVKNLKDTIKDLGNKSIRELGFTTMYIDLNSCFATIEQQARPRLRGKPVGIINRMAKNTSLIAASIEAKKMGVKVGMRAEEAKQIAKNIIFAETEPSKYIFVHNKLKNILKSYSSCIEMKSIDEGLIDLSKADQKTRSKTPKDLANEIKTRLKNEVGCYMKCSIGFSYNRFLAKLAGELHKPDGINAITQENIVGIFSNLKLTDLPGINQKLKQRLKTYGITNPVELLNAKEATLRVLVMNSIEGTKWYFRLRGVEVDERVNDTKSIGRQFVLAPNTNVEDAKMRLTHLAEDIGFRLRSQNLYARGIYVWITFNLYGNPKTIHKNILQKHTICSDAEIIKLTKELFNQIIQEAPDQNPRIIGVTAYKLEKEEEKQLDLFNKNNEKAKKISKTIDEINQKFGARTIHSAYTLKTNDMHAKIPFGSTRYLDKNIG